MVSYGISHKGNVRNENQDAYLNLDTPIGVLDNIYIVADGMGGHKGGAIASKIAVDTINDFIKGANGQVLSIIEESIIKANLNIYKKAVEDSSLFGMGTTIDVMTIKDNILYIGHVGDSRVYYFDSSNELVQLTKDHSYVQELIDAGVITEEEAYCHPNKNLITRAAGIDKEVKIDLIQLDDFEPTSMRAILCSDGLTNMLKNSEIKTISELDAPMRIKCEQLLNQSLENGGIDNITVILVENEKGWWNNA
jgi:protein phosphatase